MNDKDFKIEITKGSGPGGQHKNKVETCVKVIHSPTGIHETCQETRSKERNLKLAKSRVIKRVLAHYNKIRQENFNSIRKSQINTKRIRTYNFKTNTVIDHRTGNKANLDKVLSGDLDLLR
jgi:peptide chain release factor 1